MTGLVRRFAGCVGSPKPRFCLNEGTVLMEAKMTKLISTGRMRYGTRMLTANQEFDAPGQDARVLVAIGKARVADYKPRQRIMPERRVEAQKEEPPPESKSYLEDEGSDSAGEEDDESEDEDPEEETLG